MKIHTILIVILTILGLISGSCDTPKSTSPEYEIYSKILSAFKANILVVWKYTKPILNQDYDFEILVKSMPTLQKDTFDDFIQKYKITDTLENVFITTKMVILVKPGEEIEKVISSLKDFSGKDINKIKIQGTTSFSRVGFNTSETQAILCDWTQTGFLGGSGYISLFEKRNKKWILKSNFLIGIS